jgi:hypothetical protein
MAIRESSKWLVEVPKWDLRSGFRMEKVKVGIGGLRAAE